MRKVKSTIYKSLIFFILSFLIVAFSQPAWNEKLGYAAAFLGYFLFWLSICNLKSNKLKFLVSFIWFGLVQSVQLSWMTSTKYQGKLILAVYFFVLAWFGFQFAIVSYLALKDKKINFFKIFFMASVWAILEWSRLFFMCGFSFNQIGMAYANNHYSLQLAAVLGIYSLSFYIIFINLTALKAFLDKSFKLYVLWVLLFLFPYIYGYFHEKIYERKFNESETINVCLVQTALLPEQKILTQNYLKDFVSPVKQWDRIINFINKKDYRKIDLIVLPEAALPYGANDFFYPFDCVQRLFVSKFGEDILNKLPSLKEPFAKMYDDIWYVSNSYFAKTLANIYDAEIAVGLDDFDAALNQNYNAAFYFHPQKETFQRYEKQVLVPIGEYIPFSFVSKWAKKKYGIASSFTKGKGSKIFSDRAFSFSICYEETYPGIMRNAKNKGARCFVNLSNDAYFFDSKLFRQHFDHAKVRAIENGLPLIRACNTGISGGIDSFGRVVKALYSESQADAVFVQMPLFSYDTLYSFWGNYVIIGFSTIVFFYYLIQNKKKNKL